MRIKNRAAKAAFFILAATSLSACLSKNTRKNLSGDAQTAPQERLAPREACLALNSEDVLDRINIAKDGSIFLPRDLTTDDNGNVIAIGMNEYAVTNNPDGANGLNHWIVKRYGTDGTVTVLQDERIAAEPESVVATGNVILVAGIATANLAHQLRGSFDGGRTWSVLRSVADDPTKTSPDRVRLLPDGSLYFLASGANVFRSADGGVNWTQVTVPNLSTAVDVTGDAAGNTFLYGTFKEADTFSHWVTKKSVDGAVTWTDSDDFLPTGATGISAFSASSDGSGAIYTIGIPLGLATSSLVIRKTTDSGATWVEIDPSRPVYMIDKAGAYYTSDSAGPGSDMTFSRSSDGGATWTEISRSPAATSNAYPNTFMQLDSYGNALLSEASYDLGATPPVWKGQIRHVGARLSSALSRSCLFSNLTADQANPNVLLYEPQYPLWSDGATKRRWIYLPPGKKIDTTDMDSWQFPVGTRLFKEFTRDGKRVETRVLVKAYAGTGFSTWRAGTYKWNAQQNEAQLSFSATTGALGTLHNVPNVTQCATCHKGSKDFVLGFDALQLSKADALTGKTFIEKLTADGRLTAPPAAPIAIQGSPKAQAALGYLHANCASCHNPIGSMPVFNFKHNANATSLQTENGYIAAVTGAKVVPGDPSTSRIHIRMNLRPGGMPTLGSSVIDSVGLQTIDDWILELP